MSVTNRTRFKRARAESPEPKPEITAWIPPADKAQAEAGLFDFLRSLRDGRPQATSPLLLERPALRALYTEPHPDLVEILRHCLCRLLVELDTDPGRWGTLELGPAVWGMALAAHNSLVRPLSPGEGPADLVTGYTLALLDTLPPARELPAALAYHALVHLPAEALPFLPAGRVPLVRGLLDRSPLSAVCHLHGYTPPPLTHLAAGLLPHWRRRAVDPAPWSGLDDWLDVLIPLLARRPIAAFLRHRWLALPETRRACRNLGLLLEALRRRGNHRRLLLDFYEAYDYRYGEEREDALGRAHRCWPLLEQIRHVLCTGGECEAGLEAALRLNRRGNEWFLKFHPLVQIIAEEGRVPTDYNLLDPGWLPALRSLLDFTAEGERPRLDLGAIEYAGAEEE